MSENWGVSIDLELDGDSLTMKGCRSTRAASEMQFLPGGPTTFDLSEVSEEIRARILEALFVPEERSQS
jgi:hypothetical protein